MQNDKSNEIDLIAWIKYIWQKKLLIIIPAIVLTIISIALLIFFKWNRYTYTFQVKPVPYHSEIKSVESIILSSLSTDYQKVFGSSVDFSLSDLSDEIDTLGELTIRFESPDTNISEELAYTESLLLILRTETIKQNALNIIQKSETSKNFLDENIEQLQYNISRNNTTAVPTTINNQFFFSKNDDSENGSEFQSLNEIIPLLANLSSGEQKQYFTQLLKLWETQYQYYEQTLDTEFQLLQILNSLNLDYTAGFDSNYSLISNKLAEWDSGSDQMLDKTKIYHGSITVSKTATNYLKKSVKFGTAFLLAYLLLSIAIIIAAKQAREFIDEIKKKA